MRIRRAIVLAPEDTRSSASSGHVLIRCMSVSLTEQPPDERLKLPASQPSRRAPRFGRGLRILVGLALMTQVAPIYFHIDARLTLGAVLLMLALLLVYSLLHVVVSRRLVALGSGLGAVVGLGVLVALYLGGGRGGPLLGRGEGELAAGTFLAVSLILAGLRGDPGCEVMAIPDALFGRSAEVACLVFSPLDWLERKWRRRGSSAPR